MVISPEFRMRQHRDEDHQEDAPHFTIPKDLVDYITNGEFDPKKHVLKVKQKGQTRTAAQKNYKYDLVDDPDQML